MSCSIDEDCAHSLDAHRPVLLHLLDTDAAGLTCEAVKSARRAIFAKSPSVEPQEIQVICQSTGQMRAQRQDYRPG